MSLPFAIEHRLSKSHLAEFHELILDTAILYDDAHAWVMERGYRISRNAVGNYIRHARSHALFPLRRLVGLGDDTRLRAASSHSGRRN